MMNFSEFKERVLSELEARYPGNVEVVKATKTNVVLTSVVITNKKACRAAYLDFFYDDFLQEEKSLETIIEEIIASFEEEIPDAIKSCEIENIDVSQLYACIINTEKNEEFLKGVPHREFLDLSIVARVLVEKNEDGRASFVVNKSILEKSNLNISEEELIDIALENTRKLFVFKCKTLIETLSDLQSDVANPVEIPNEGPKEGIPYVVAVDDGICGSIAITFTDIFKDMSEKQNSDLFILPSSIHEIIVMPVDESKTDECKNMIADINEYVVSETDFLSNSLYRYFRDEDCIKLV